MKKKIFLSIFSLVISLIVILSTSVTIIFYVNYEKREIINLQNVDTEHELALAELAELILGGMQ